MPNHSIETPFSHGWARGFSYWYTRRNGDESHAGDPRSLRCNNEGGNTADHYIGGIAPLKTLQKAWQRKRRHAQRVRGRHDYNTHQDQVVGALSWIMPNMGGLMTQRRRPLASVAVSVLLYAAPIYREAMITKSYPRSESSLSVTAIILVLDMRFFHGIAWCHKVVAIRLAFLRAYSRGGQERNQQTRGGRRPTIWGSGRNSGNYRTTDHGPTDENRT